MTSLKRNMSLTTKAMNGFLVASTLAICVSSVNTAVDGFIVGRFVAPEALSAVNLFSPFSRILSAVFLLLLFSASNQAAYFIGERNRKRSCEFVMTSFVMLFGVGILLSLVALLFTDSYVSLVCFDESVRPHLHTYFRIVGGGSILVVLVQFVEEVVNIEGRPSLGMRVIAISVLCNIVLDVLFTVVLGFGVAGSAVATLIAYMVVIASLCRFHLFTRESSFSFHFFRKFSLSALKSILKLGVVMAPTDVVLAAFLYIVNYCVQRNCGGAGLFALSVGMIVFDFCTKIAIGIGRMVLCVGGFLKGQHDWLGFRYVVNHSLRMPFVIGSAVSLAMIPCSRILAQMFGARSPELVDFTAHALKIFIWMLPFSMLSTLLMFVYQSLMKAKLLPVPTIAFSVVVSAALILWPHFMSRESLWFAFPLAAMLSVVVIFLFGEFDRRGDKAVCRLSLVPRLAETESAEQCQLSVLANRDEITPALNTIESFFKKQKTAQEFLDRLRLSLEEVFLNIVEHAGLKGKKHCFDVIVRVEREGVLCVIKDDGKAFNPLVVDKEKQGMGIRILLNVCKHVDYQYMYGQNIIFLQLPYEKYDSKSDIL